jgi:hypothetical protein
MLFYRVENNNGRGCYQNNQGIIPSGATDRHPMPNKDSLLKEKFPGDISDYFNGNWRFGFESINQFRAWFFNDEWLKSLDRDGFKLSIYDVPASACFFGNSQGIMKAKYHTDIFLKESKALTDFIVIPA